MQMRTENGRERGHVEGCRVSLDCELQLVNNRCVTDTNTIECSQFLQTVPKWEVTASSSQWYEETREGYGEGV